MKALKSVAATLGVAVLVAAAPLTAPEAPVADAAQQGDVEQVQALIREGADVNAPQGDGMTALHWAALNGDADIAELLIYAGANQSATTRLGAYTPLHLAAANAHAEVTRALLEAGSDVAAVTSTGATPLHLAADAGNPDVVRALVEHGADPNALESYAQRTPLMFAAARSRVEAVRALLEAGADPSLTTRVIDYSERAKSDGPERAQRQRRVAVERGEEPPEPRGRGFGGGGGGGGGGAQPADSGRARPLNYDDLVGRQGGMTALHYAARDGHTETVLALLDGGADINEITEGDHSTPMLVAVINGNFDLAKMMLARGADPNKASEDGVAPLFAAINTQWNLRTWYPQPTAYQQQQTSYLDLMRALLEAGADPNTRLTQHLWYSAYNTGRMGVDYMGATAFWRAAYATDVEAMKLLVAYGADPNIPTLRPPDNGRGRGGDEEDPSGLPPVPPGGPGVYPIHAATGVGFGTSRVGQQHRSVPGGWLPAVKYLVEELGADVNVRDFEGYSAVHHAAARGDNEVILYLVEHGADVTFVSRRGQTTVDMANGPQQRVQPFPETIALLESLGAKNNHKCQSC